MLRLTMGEQQPTGMGSSQSPGSHPAALSQSSPNFGRQGPMACPCHSGADSMNQFLGESSRPSASIAPPSLNRPGPSMAPSNRTSPSPEAPTPQVGNDEASPSSQHPNMQALLQTLPAGRRQAAAQHFPTILAECERQNVTDPNQISYILATAAHESNAGQNMEELASGRAYEGRSSLGNNQAGDGPRFKGRGYVQITGRRNYTDWSRRLGMDLVGNPEMATQPRVAARILVEGMMQGTFTGRALPDYVGQGRSDFSNARRVVNGTDRAGDIASIAQRLRSALG